MLSSSFLSQIPQSLENGPGCIKVVSGSGFRYLVPFPYKLHKMLEETEQKGEAYTSIVSWLPDGRHFRVHDSRAFMTHVVPQFFKQKSYKSFQRQLHIYGFKRILKGEMQGAFHHPKFIKGNRELTHEIDRIKAPVARKNARPAMETNTTTKERRSISPRQSHADSTMEWLMSSGIMFSELEPCHLIQGVRTQIGTCNEHKFSSDLLSQADQISSLFTSKEFTLSTKQSMELLSDPRKPSYQTYTSSLVSLSDDNSTDDKNLSLSLHGPDSFSILCLPPSGQEASFAPTSSSSISDEASMFQAV